MIDSSLTFEADRERGFVRICLRGEPDAKEILNALHQVTTSYPGHHRLWDCRGVRHVQWSADQLRSLARMAASYGAGATVRVAILVGEGFLFGMARMYEMVAESTSAIQHAVFSDEAEALAWVQGERA
jgi:hypothetical protein